MASIEDILKKLKKDAVNILQTKVGDKVKQELKENTNKLLYEAYEPSEYERTFELRDSVSKIPLPNRVKIFFDTNKIEPHINEDNWNSHADIKGNDVSEMIPEYMEKGHGGLYQQKGRGMVQTTRDEIESSGYHKKILEEELKRNGYKI